MAATRTSCTRTPPTTGRRGPRPCPWPTRSPQAPTSSCRRSRSARRAALPSPAAASRSCSSTTATPAPGYRPYLTAFAQFTGDAGPTRGGNRPLDPTTHAMPGAGVRQPPGGARHAGRGGRRAKWRRLRLVAEHQQRHLRPRQALSLAREPRRRGAGAPQRHHRHGQERGGRRAGPLRRHRRRRRSRARLRVARRRTAASRARRTSRRRATPGPTWSRCSRTTASRAAGRSGRSPSATRRRCWPMSGRRCASRRVAPRRCSSRRPTPTRATSCATSSSCRFPHS